MIERSEQGTDPAPAVDGTPLGTAGSPAAGAPGPWPPPGNTAPPPPPSPRTPWPAPPSRVPADGRDVPDGAPPAGTTEGSVGDQLRAGGAPKDPPSAWFWLLFAALGFLGGQVVATVIVAVSAAVSGHLSSLSAIAKLSEPPTWYIVSSLVGLWAGFFGAAWLSIRVRGTRSFARDLGLRFRWVDLSGIPIGVGGQILVALMYVPIAQHVSNFNQRFNAPAHRLTGGSHGTGYVVIAVCTVVGAPFFEELFFRGVLLRALTRLFGLIGRRVGAVLAVLVTGLLFGLAHAESLQLLGLATFGVILSIVAYRTGRLGMSMVAHATFNLMAVATVVAPLTLGGRTLF